MSYHHDQHVRTEIHYRWAQGGEAGGSIYPASACVKGLQETRPAEPPGRAASIAAYITLQDCPEAILSC